MAVPTPWLEGRVETAIHSRIPCIPKALSTIRTPPQILPSDVHRAVQGTGALHEFQIGVGAQNVPNPFDRRGLGVAYRHSDRNSIVVRVAIGHWYHRYHRFRVPAFSIPSRTWAFSARQHSSSGGITVLVVGTATGSHVMIASSRITSLETIPNWFSGPHAEP
jgi:hypothetical protein